MSSDFAFPKEGKYIQLLGFDKNPFPVVPDANDYFITTALKTLVYELLFAISERKGFVVVTGEVGLGKSTLSRFLLKNIDKEPISYALILNSYLQEENLLDEILRDFGLPRIIGSLQDKLYQLNAFLLKENAKGRNCVLIVDDAQNLTIKSLETLRLLSNLETEHKKLIQILLIGQPELYGLLDSSELRQMKSRVNLFRQINPLTKAEHKAYICYKLDQSSGVKPCLNNAAYKALYKYTAGNIRRTNLFLDRILISLISEPNAKVNRRYVVNAVKDCDPSSSPKHSVVGLVLLFITLLVISSFIYFEGNSTIERAVDYDLLNGSSSAQALPLIADVIIQNNKQVPSQNIINIESATNNASEKQKELPNKITNYSSALVQFFNTHKIDNYVSLFNRLNVDDTESQY